MPKLSGAGSMPADTELYLRLVAALCVGGVLGLERSYHARPAGFRTHALVCLSCALLMSVTIDSADWLADRQAQSVGIDPTRVIQGLMTGIGFLGAGTIIKEGLSVRGLTTAASIWATAAVGVVFGLGLIEPALVASALIFVTLSIFRWFEAWFPAQIHMHIDVGCSLDAELDEQALRKLFAEQAVLVMSLSQRMNRDAQRQHYSVEARSSDEAQLQTLISRLREMPQLTSLSAKRRLP